MLEVSLLKCRYYLAFDLAFLDLSNQNQTCLSIFLVLCLLSFTFKINFIGIKKHNCFQCGFLIPVDFFFFLFPVFFFSFALCGSSWARDGVWAGAETYTTAAATHQIWIRDRTGASTGTNWVINPLHQSGNSIFLFFIFKNVIEV